MVVVMQEGAREEQIQSVIDRLIQMGFDVHRSTGAAHTVLGAVGGAPVDRRDIELLQGVREGVKLSASYKLAGRAFKPRTSPYSFQGMGEQGLKVLRKAADENGLLVISEIMNQTQIPMFLDYV